MRFIIIVGILVASITAFLKGGESVLAYPFDPRHVSPSEAGEARLSEINVTTSDEETLIIWHAKAKLRKPTILYFHGNAGGLKDRVQRFDRLLDRGYGIIAPAYRRSSGSTGKPTEEVMSRDAIEVLARFNATENIIYYGESLGTGVAVKLAVEHPPIGLVLEAPYTSIPDVAAISYPIPGLRSLMKETWHTEEHIKQVHVPTLIIHGTNDQVIPFELGQRVFKASPATQKTFLRARGLGHNNLWTSKNQLSIYRFIDALR